MHSTLNQPFVQSALFGICSAAAIHPFRDLPRFGDPPFAGSAPLRRSALFGIRPAIAIRLPQKQKSERFCNFIAIADSSLPLQSGNEPI